MISNVTLGVFITPETTPYVDFDLLKRNGVEFVVCWTGEGKNLDFLLDREDKMIDGVPWWSHAVSECYRVDIPIFAYWYMYEDRPDNTNGCIVPQLASLNYLLQNKTIGGIFIGNNWRDRGTNNPIPSNWLSERKLGMINETQKVHTDVWVGPYNGNAYRNYAKEQFENWLGKDGPSFNEAGALFWAEWDTHTVGQIEWSQLDSIKPVSGPKLLPPNPKDISKPTKWYLWNWCVDVKLPGFYLDKEKTILGTPNLIFFNGSKTQLHDFAFYKSHGYTDPNEEQEEEENNENPIPGSGIPMYFKDIIEEMRLMRKAIEKLGNITISFKDNTE